MNKLLMDHCRCSFVAIGYPKNIFAPNYHKNSLVLMINMTKSLHTRLWLKLQGRVELGIQKPSYWKVCFQTDLEFLLGLVFMMISLLQNRKTSKWWFLQNCYSYRRFLCFEKIQFCDIACVTTVGLYFNDMNSLWGTNTYITSKIRLRFYFEYGFCL